ncbi:MAG: hypothetical protein AAF726_24310 [Planctomycetota bacterium]
MKVLLSALVSLVFLCAAAPLAPVQTDGQAEEKKEAKAAEKEEWKGEPYLLEVCAASGRPLDVKNSRTTRVIEGRELKFCCEGCADVVEEEPEEWIPKVDEKIAERQAAIYPTTQCVIAGTELIKDGEDVAEAFVVKNRLFRTCCPSCAKKVKADPEKYAEKLDQLAARAQAKDYPLEACLVNEDAELNAKSKKFVIGGRLLQTCCGRCEGKVRKDPAEYVAKVDAERAKAIAAKRKEKAAEPAEKKKGDGGL